MEDAHRAICAIRERGEEISDASCVQPRPTGYQLERQEALMKIINEQEDVVLRTTGLPETATIDIIFTVQGKALGMTRETFQTFLESRTHTRRSTTLAELTNAAVFLASDLAAGLTGTVANLTGGESTD
jgi:hypothetical protein